MLLLAEVVPDVGIKESSDIIEMELPDASVIDSVQRIVKAGQLVGRTISAESMLPCMACHSLAASRLERSQVCCSFAMALVSCTKCCWLMLGAMLRSRSNAVSCP